MQPKPARSIQRRLPRHTIDQLVQDDRDGATALELAARYDISKTAVLNLLTREGATRRHQPLTDADINHLENLYLAGHTLTSCSRLTGTHPPAQSKTPSTNAAPHAPRRRPPQPHMSRRRVSTHPKAQPIQTNSESLAIAELVSRAPPTTSPRR